ncbi:MAG: glycosyltransferase family 4 protein [Pseudomonadota bacterium]
MKIAIVLPPRFTFDRAMPNSIETVVRTLNRYSRYRAEITVIADEGADQHGDLTVLTVPAERNRWRRTAHVIEALREIGPDLLELHQHAPTARRIARALPGIPSLFYRHNYVKPPSGWFRRWRHRRRNQEFDAHVFVSKVARDAFAAAFPEFGGTSHAILNGVEIADWHAEPDPARRLIAYAGRAAPEKGFGEFCAAVDRVLDAHPDWSAGIYGSAWTTHGAWAEAQVASLERFGARVEIARNQPLDAVQALLARAAIVAVPSHIFESFGLAAVEAHAAGAAVISSGRGGLREASGPHASYVDPITPGSLAAAITALIQDPDERLRLARDGQAHAVSNHSAAARAAELDALRTRMVSAT